MKIRKTFWGFLAVFAASSLGAMLTRDEFYYRIAYVIGFLILVSFCWAFFSIKGIQINRFARVTRQQVGQLFDETVEVVNKYHLLRLWLEVRDKTPLPGSSGSRVLSWIQGNSIRSYSVYTLLIKRGNFSLGPTIISSGDPFGLFVFKKNYAWREEFVGAALFGRFEFVPISTGFTAGRQSITPAISRNDPACCRGA